jgi:hypothetical protein
MSKITLPNPTGITAPQTALFWRRFTAACSALSIASHDREAYRKRILREELGVEHMSEIDRTTGFDKIMRRLCIDADNYEEAWRYEVGDERRLVAMVEACAAQLMQIIGGNPRDASSYIAVTCTQAGFPVQDANPRGYWMDMTSGMLQACFQMLDTHRRRLLRREGWGLPGIGRSLKFDIAARYEWVPVGISLSLLPALPGHPVPPAFFKVTIKA